MSDEAKELRGLDTVRVTVFAVKKALTENRSKHQSEYEDAVKGYNEQLLKNHKKALMKAMKADRSEPIQVQMPYLPAPTKHTREYDEAIRMLDMSQDNELVLDASEFRQYVMDEWDWTASTSMTNAVYAARVRR